MVDIFKEQKTIDWGVDTTPLYGGRKVDVIAVKGNQRQVQWFEPGEAEPTKRWVGLEDLIEMCGVPIPPRGESLSVVAAEDAVIAQIEIDLAQQRDEMAKRIAELEEMLRQQTEAYDGKLKHQHQVAVERLKDRDAAQAKVKTLEAVMPPIIMPNRPRHETKIVFAAVGQASLDEALRLSLERFEGEGWNIAFEQYQAGSSERPSSYFARLTREAQAPAHNPQPDVRVALAVSVVEPAAEEAPEDNTVIMGSHWEDVADIEETMYPDLWKILVEDPNEIEEDDLQSTPVMLLTESAWTSEPDPLTRDRMIYEARKATAGSKAAGRMIAQERSRAKHARGEVATSEVRYLTGELPVKPIPQNVQVGNLVRDRKKYPITSTMMKHNVGAAEILAVMDLQIKMRVETARQTSLAQQPSFPPLMLGQ